ncbi:uncharacterized protein LOC120679533 isoform X2 [Panicum virgatum]|uniref:Uncharacterized protein n=1 Tax=Panicum virgatum TaxID=38727 RepID=A0A8T0R1Q4_PANVG|nr:uncharacterized protein LOC120679533 isoform X2 [Panicum virgatum]KAG2579491.1 hypothetical protein PVAP13_6NG288800 [Panicum virgatum]
MPSSPWPPTAGAPPPRPAQDMVSTEALERRPVEGSRSPPAQEEGSVAVADSAQEARARPLSVDYFSEVKTKEHGEKINRYQGMLAARLKAKYFSNKTSEKGYMFEEIVIQSETIRLSRWPFTRHVCRCTVTHHNLYLWKYTAINIIPPWGCFNFLPAIVPTSYHL